MVRDLQLPPEKIFFVIKIMKADFADSSLDGIPSLSTEDPALPTGGDAVATAVETVIHNFLASPRHLHGFVYADVTS